jgi:hypothetical protein
MVHLFTFLLTPGVRRVKRRAQMKIYYLLHKALVVVREVEEVVEWARLAGDQIVVEQAEDEAEGVEFVPEANTFPSDINNRRPFYIS